MKVLFKGYYGFGNLGDDILMAVSLGLAKKHFEKTEIYIQAGNKNYMPEWLDLSSVKIITENEAALLDWDLIVHGGGGVFFDFKKGSIKDSIKNLMVKSSITFPLMKSRLRQKSKRRIMVGVGVGTYTKSSAKYFQNVLQLNSADRVIVRDSKSLENLKKLNLTVHSELGSDLAFFHQYWRREISSGGENYVVVVLRDWKGLEQGQFEIVSSLQGMGVKIIWVSFHENEDRNFLEIAGNAGGDVVAYDRTLSCWERISSLIGGATYVISSRAHGAIVAACYGIPSIVLDIEPKLKTVQEMLPNSVKVLEAVPELSELEKAIVNKPVTSLVESDVKSCQYKNRIIEDEFIRLKP